MQNPPPLNSGGTVYIDFVDKLKTAAPRHRPTKIFLKIPTKNNKKTIDKCCFVCYYAKVLKRSNTLYLMKRIENNMNLFETQGAHLLIDAIKKLDNEQDIKDFLTDLMTTKEFIDMAQRMQVVELLNQGIVYSKIAKETGASTATISRVSRALNYGADGYSKVFEKINK